jgi:phosphate transport system substrate-binding protein
MKPQRKAQALAAASVLTLAGLAALGALGAPALAQSLRDQIRITGSSTVFPFTTTVAERFASKTSFRAPIVESTGTGGGLKQFCAGVGAEHPDIANASRRIKRSEFDDCIANGVDGVIEMPIGFDGIVLANAKRARRLTLTRREIFEAVAARLPASDDDCTLAPNAHVLWSDVNPDLPAIAIEVYGPPPTSGTRDAFVEVGLEAGARDYACLAAIEAGDADAFRAIAHTVREDGAWIDSGENDNAIVATLENTPTAIGVFGFSFLDQNADRIQGAVVEGHAPTFEEIAAGNYPISRSLYIYIKSQHIGVVPGIAEFLVEFSSEDAAGDFGYLAEKGLIPLPEDRRAEVAASVAAFEVMTGEEGI